MTKKDHYDGPGEMWEQELEMIRDPRTGKCLGKNYSKLKWLPK